MASVAESSTPTSPEPDYSNEPGPPPFTAEFDGKRWELEIGQQPIRARMCGFGDKDRRPISPPPCIRLIVRDLATNEEIDLNKHSLSLFVLTVDLWNKDATAETNLVKHATSSPSISSVSTSAYPLTVTEGYTMTQTPTQAYTAPNMPTYTGQNFTSPVSTTPSTASTFANYTRQNDGRYSNSSTSGNPYPQTLGVSPYQQGYSQSSGSGSNGYQIPPIGSMPPPSPYARDYEFGRPDYGHLSSVSSQSGGTAGMFTRNLIGNLTASAFRLKDTTDKEGIWFVMQDLSIRTEGWFRLKFSFVNLGQKDAQRVENGVENGTSDSTLVGIGENAPCLATCFSAPFHVWSAKKFPGVIESTELSKKFAAQGIKIPIRKEGKDGRTKRKRGKGDDYESSEEEDD